MKMHRYVIVVVVSLSVVLLTGSTDYTAQKIRGPLKDAQTNKDSQPEKTHEPIYQMHSLRGLKEVVVEVVGRAIIDGLVVNHSALADYIRTQVEPRLVQNGLSLLPSQGIDRSKDTRPRFLVYISRIQLEPNKWIIDVETRLNQEVMLKRDTSIPCLAITWQRTRTLGQMTDNLQSDVSVIVKEHLDSFINDYLIMNPKQPPNDK